MVQVELQSVSWNDIVVGQEKGGKHTSGKEMMNEEGANEQHGVLVSVWPVLKILIYTYTSKRVTICVSLVNEHIPEHTPKIKNIY